MIRSRSERSEIAMPISMRSLAGLVLLVALGTAGCCRLEPRLYAPLQANGWSAQPVGIECRFAPDADLDPATHTPVGDEGYYLYILTRSAAWDYRDIGSYFLSHLRQQWGHCWLILESPEKRLECGVNGNFGRERPKYGDALIKKLRAGDPNPISYLWVTMTDGKIELGNGNRTPTFVWRMPITKRRHDLIDGYLTQRNNEQIDVRTSNCVDMVTEAAGRAGINFIHRIRIAFPPETKILWTKLRIWTDSEYRILEYSTPDMLEADLRQLARFGIGSDRTEWYLASPLAVPKSKDGAMTGGKSGERDEAGRQP